MTFHEYIASLNTRYRGGISKEHAYRGDLEHLLRALTSGVEITNEPSNVTDCGNPDYVIMRGKIPVGYIEAKDIGKDLVAAAYQEQFDRYRAALDNLIITDYLWFRFYQHGKLVYEVRIGEVVDGGVVPLADNFAELQHLITDFCTYVGQTIKSATRLAELMAGKARLLQIALHHAVESDEASEDNTALRGQMQAFRNELLHDINPREFADIYAQTLAYGMFAARLHDPTLDTFSRQEAAELIPKTNPFLRKLFQYIAGYDIDQRIRATVDNLADVFRATDVRALLENFGQATQRNDPIVNFYEDFLTQYDPRLRKSRGVWYTPQPVVRFMVRAVDRILTTDFGIRAGLADTEKKTIKLETQISDGRTRSGYRTMEQEIHRVQILDPATGTGTFLAEIIEHIYTTRFAKMQGIWSRYVEQDLLPRLNGFELLMAPYAMAHLKLDLLLNASNYRPHRAQRFRVFLTNALEEHHADTGTLFAAWLASEVKEANLLKRDTPVMVVVGNPPYSGETANKGKWISDLLADYKQEPSGGPLREKTTKWLNDDYVKFIRFGQRCVERNGEGVLAYINNHSFLDNPTFRGMRYSLLRAFDTIYVLDLHGNAKKKETCPDGSLDQNVFDIQQGVSINIFVKTGKSKRKLARVLHHDVHGRREAKYSFLDQSQLDTVAWTELKPEAPHYFLLQRDLSAIQRRADLFKLDELFVVQGNGVVTKRDKLAIQFTRQAALQAARDICELPQEQFYARYALPKDVRDWRYQWAREDIEAFGLSDRLVRRINYRPFDVRYVPYTGRSRGFIGWPVVEVMSNYIDRQNVGLLASRMTKGKDFAHCFVTSIISEAIFLSSITGTNAFNMPLYIYHDAQPVGLDQAASGTTREPNLSAEVVAKMAARLELEFAAEATDAGGDEIVNTPGTQRGQQFAPLDVLDYVYALLHSPAYRQEFGEALKIDYPHLPLPDTRDRFWKLVGLGGELRQVHLLLSPRVDAVVTSYPVDGDNVITRKIGKADWKLTGAATGQIWINKQQYFDEVPLVAWELWIGGYQPAQKWLKMRVGQELTVDDIMHYQRVITALNLTHQLMQQIDLAGVPGAARGR